MVSFSLSGFYWRFVRCYAQIATPLTNLLCTNCFKWDDKVEATFEHLKHVLTSTPILCLPDFSSTFIVETDASGATMGASLVQVKKVDPSHTLAINYAHSSSTALHTPRSYVQM